MIFNPNYISIYSKALEPHTAEKQIAIENHRAAKSSFDVGGTLPPSTLHVDSPAGSSLRSSTHTAGYVIIGGHGKPAPEKFCHCRRCGLLLITESLTAGRCAMCRADVFINVTVATVILCIIMLLLAACTSGEGDKPSTEWKRCVKNGDWLETPYCDAVSRGEGNV